MNVRRTAIGAVAALVAIAALILSAAGSASPSQEFKMAIFTDIGSLQDRSFNQLANEGRIAIGKELGIQTRAYVTKKEAERIPNALAASRAGYNLIFGVGFLNYTAINAGPGGTGQARRLIGVKLEAVGHQVLKDTPELRVVAADDR